MHDHIKQGQYVYIPKALLMSNTHRLDTPTLIGAAGASQVNGTRTIYNIGPIFASFQFKYRSTCKSAVP